MKRRRNLLIFVGAGYLCLWCDLLIGHGAAGFRHAGMWIPAVLLPPAITISFVFAAHPARRARHLFDAACRGALVIGILGFTFHAAKVVRELYGVADLGALTRLVRYPPVFAPLAISALGILGWLAEGENKWKRRALRHFRSCVPPFFSQFLFHRLNRSKPSRNRPFAERSLF